MPATDSIDIAKDMVNRLEQEQKLAQEKLRKAHEQLVMTLKGELEQVRIQHEPSTPNLSLKLARGGWSWSESHDVQVYSTGNAWGTCYAHSQCSLGVLGTRSRSFFKHEAK